MADDYEIHKNRQLINQTTQIVKSGMPILKKHTQIKSLDRFSNANSGNKIDGANSQSLRRDLTKRNPNQ